MDFSTLVSGLSMLIKGGVQPEVRKWWFRMLNKILYDGADGTFSGELTWNSVGDILGLIATVFWTITFFLTSLSRISVFSPWDVLINQLINQFKRNIFNIDLFY